MYRVRLEDILNDIIIISEIAELSIEADSIVNVLGLQPDNEVVPEQVIAVGIDNPGQSLVSTVRWSDVKFKREETVSQLESGTELPRRNTNGLDMEGERFSEQMNLDLDGEKTAEKRNEIYESSCRLSIMDLLDKWDEPVNKRDKVRTEKDQPWLQKAK
jgi:hypothetical protein